MKSKTLPSLLRTMALPVVCMCISSATFAQYCTPTYTTGTVEGDYCGYVGLGTIDNATDGAPDPFYSDFTAMSTDLVTGATYTITLGSGTYTSNNDLACWIDYNQDGDFDDAGELVATVLDLTAMATGTADFTVPLTALGGSTRMRVREIYNMPTPPSPCDLYSFGETEDYTVNIMGYTNDVGIVDITSPTTGTGLGIENVTATIQNFGSAEASEINVYFQVDGGTVYSSPFLGTIPAYGSASFTFDDTYDFSELTCYSISVWTEYELDEFADDDLYMDDVCHVGPVTGTGAMYIYSNTTGGEPWFNTTNSDAMNVVFGPEGTGWTRDYYETVDVASAFGPDNCFIFLEGSDAHAIELETFLTENIGAVESWVASGGHLLLNAAPNEGDGMSFGFDGTNLIYDGGSGMVTAADPGHPIFNGPYLPCGTDFTGGNFSHARVSGTDITSVIIESGTTDITLGEKTWGDGRVMFGGMTTYNFHDPDPNAANLRQNIFAYLNCLAVAVCEVPSGLSADGITDNDATLHWNEVDGADQYRVTLQNTATGLIKTRGYYTNSVEIVDKLTPLTTYAFRVKTVCYDDLGEISDPSEWYYFTTLGRIGANANGSVVLYPNPTSGNFNIQLNDLDGNDLQLEVYNNLGAPVYTQAIHVTNSNTTIQVALEGVAAGMYQVRLVNGDMIMNYPIMVNY